MQFLEPKDPVRLTASEFEFEIRIKPVPKGRPRMLRNGRVYSPAETRNFEDALRAKFRQIYQHEPLMGALVVVLHFYLKRPASCPKDRRYPSVRPDLDNFCKSVLDAMNGVLFLDDGQVTDLRIKKRYGDSEKIVGFLRICR